MFDFNLSNFNITTIGIGIYLIALGIFYYVIFHKHHKRNKVEFNELISLLTKYYSLSIISTLLIILGLQCFIFAKQSSYDRNEVILYILTGILIISASLINYIFYIKRNLKDYNPVTREHNKKVTLKIGEVLELIIFVIFMLAPIWRIPVFIDLFDNKKEMIKEIVKTFLLSIAAIILLFNLNPLNIKEKLKLSKEDDNFNSSTKNDEK